MNFDVQTIASLGWIKRWAGSYTFISCAYWGYQYYEQLRRVLGTGFDHTLFTHRQGTVSFYVVQEEFERFGKTMAEKAVTDPVLTKQWLQELKDNTDVIAPLMEAISQKIPTWEEYEQFLMYFEKHLPYHNFMKKTVDFLPEDALRELLPQFKEARLYSERVYSDTERFFRAVADKIAEKEMRVATHLTCLTKAEFEHYLKENLLPDASVLADRYELSGLYFDNNVMQLLPGNLINTLEEAIAKERASGEIRGMIGYRGKAEGTVRIVLDPFNVGEFNSGDILVTGMTRPEFLPLVEKAAAIVTDAGGILCHAAIIARELQKPCIVGTEVATKVLKPGQRVLVDAEAGSVVVRQ